MTTEEALKVLDQLAAAYVGNRADHVAIAKALDVVRSEVQKTDRGKPNDEGLVP